MENLSLETLPKVITYLTNKISESRLQSQKKGSTYQKIRLEEINERLSNHEKQLENLYEIIQAILEENDYKEKWINRKKIGFTSDPHEANGP